MLVWGTDRLTDRIEPFTVRALAHLVFPAFRVLLEVPLLAGLAKPRVSYLPVQNGVADDEVVPTASSLLLPTSDATAPSTGLSPLAGEASKYGTFRTSRSLAPTASGPTTRAPTPAPSTIRVPRKQDSKTQNKEDIALDPSWSELFHRLNRISPYLWPSKSRALQLLAVRLPYSILVLQHSTMSFRLFVSCLL